MKGPDPSGGDPNKESPAKGYLAELQTLVLFEPAIPLPVIILRELLWMGKNSPQRCFLQFSWEALPTTVIKKTVNTQQ